MSISAIRLLDQAYFSTSSKPTLRYGSSGNSVKDLQRALTSLGYNPGSIDGDFGRNTQKAVQSFQRAYGLDDDGTVGSKTWSALNGAMNRGSSVRPQSNNSSSSFTYGDAGASRELPRDYPTYDSKGRVRSFKLGERTLEKGSNGEDVKELQRRLRDLGYNPGEADGDFGSKTRSAVRDFQKAQGLEADGIVGRKTINALNATRNSGNMGDFKALERSYSAESSGHQTNSSGKASAVSFGLDFVPIVGNIKSGVEVATGKDYITGNTLSNVDRAIAAAGIVAGGGGKGIIKGIKAAGTVIKGAEKLKGSLQGLTEAEKIVVNDLLTQGKNVEIMPKNHNAKTPDFKVNGVYTELKTLENANTNTGMKRIQEGFKQGAEQVIIDARRSNLTTEQAQDIINRATGKYNNKKLPGKVEIWTNSGIITNHRRR